jgi:hypothetical protein
LNHSDLSSGTDGRQRAGIAGGIKRTDAEADQVRAADGPQQGRSREVLPPASHKPHAIYRGPRASYLKHLCRRRVDAGSLRPSESWLRARALVQAPWPATAPTA